MLLLLKVFLLLASISLIAYIWGKWNQEIEEAYPEDCIEKRSSKEGLSIVCVIICLITFVLINTWYSWVPSTALLLFGTFWDKGDQAQKKKERNRIIKPLLR